MPGDEDRNLILFPVGKVTRVDVEVGAGVEEVKRIHFAI